jgi:pimeloyl-ACP methyl ester carboxylesterase
MEHTKHSGQQQTVPYRTGSVISRDGTTIGYRQLGSGPAVVLVHGGMQAAQNFMTLGAELADAFTVFIPDRRGRGLSGPHREGHGISTECEDIDALLHETGAHHVFGLSAGALISLCAARTSPYIQHLAIFEPPLPVADTDRVAWLPRFEREIAQGQLAAAMMTGIRGAQVSPLFGLVPRFLLTPLLNLAINADAKKVKDGDVPLKEIIPTLQFDAKTVSETKGSLESFKDVRAEVLLLGGSKSPAYLKAALDALEKTLPHVTRVEFPGLDHLAPDNSGKPKIVAQELRRWALATRL